MIDSLILGMIALCVIVIVRHQRKKKSKGSCQNGCAGCPLEHGCSEKKE